MHWDIEYLEEFRTIHIRYSGTSNAEHFKRSFEECVSLAGKYKVNRFLVDTTEYTPALSAADIYGFPKAYAQLLVERQTRFAVIQPENPVTRKNLAFFETVCRNSGYLVKLFEDKESAMAWLID